MTERNRRGPRRAEWILLLFALLLPIFSAEAYVRWRGIDLNRSKLFRYDGYYGWTLDPAHSRFGVSPEGFRVPPDASDPTPTGPLAGRLLILGDSFTVGIEGPQTASYPGLLASRLGPLGWAVETRASGGWGTAQEMLALEREGPELRPDIVLLQVFPYNDLCNNSRGLAETCSWMDIHRPYFVPDGKEGLRRSDLAPLRSRLRRLSVLFGMAENRWGAGRLGEPGITNREFRERTEAHEAAAAARLGLAHEGRPYSLYPDALQPPAVQEGWQVTEALFERIRDRAREIDAALVAVVIPFDGTFEPKWSWVQHQYPDVALEPDYGTRRTESALAALDVPVVSLRHKITTSGLPPETFYRKRNRHLSPQGHEATADWVLETLRAEGILRVAD